jgi:hypothetical protein
MIKEVIITRHELYPADDPIGYCVGFSCVLENGRQFYIDDVVPLEDCKEKTEDEIAQLVWTRLKGRIDQLVSVLGSKSPIVGQSFTPPADEE